MGGLVETYVQERNAASAAKDEATAALQQKDQHLRELKAAADDAVDAERRLAAEAAQKAAQEEAARKAVEEQARQIYEAGVQTEQARLAAEAAAAQAKQAAAAHAQTAGALEAQLTDVAKKAQELGMEADALRQQQAAIKQEAGAAIDQAIAEKSTALQQMHAERNKRLGIEGELSKMRQLHKAKMDEHRRQLDEERAALVAQFDAMKASMGGQYQESLAKVQSEGLAALDKERRETLSKVAELEAKIIQCDLDRQRMAAEVDALTGANQQLKNAMSVVPAASSPMATDAPAPVVQAAVVAAAAAPAPAPAPAAPVPAPAVAPASAPAASSGPAPAFKVSEEEYKKAKAVLDEHKAAKSRWALHNQQKPLAQAKADKWWAEHPGAERRDKAVKAKTVVKYAKDYIPGRNDFLGVDTAPSSGRSRKVRFY